MPRMPPTPALIEATLSTLRAHAPFDAMASEHLAYMAQHLRVAYFTGGEALLSPATGAPDDFFVIRSGRVVGEDENGEARWQLTAGECFPLGALLSRRPVTNIYRAVGDTFCYLLPAAEFYRLMEQSIEFRDFCTHRIASLLAQSRRSVQSHYAVANSGDALEAPLSGLLRREAVTCAEGTTVDAALITMREHDVGSIVVVGEDGAAAGIFTLRDLRDRVVIGGCNVGQRMGEVMTRDPVALPQSAPAFEAAITMASRGIHHIVVTDGRRVVGVVSEKSLFAFQRIGVTGTSEAIRTATTVEALSRAADDIRSLARNLIAQGVSAEHLTRIVSTLNDHLTQRLITLEVERAGVGDLSFCWMALGSEGRAEQTLATDQDNGIVFASGTADAEHLRQRLLPCARSVNEALARCGFPLCRGGVMAGSAKWCLSLEEWKATFADWIHRGDATALLHASIFFDFRPLWGATALTQDLRDWLNPAIRDNRLFLRHMVENALANRPPLGIIRDFVLDSEGAHPNTLDLKVSGVTPFVDAARVFALHAALSETNTPARLRATGRLWNSPAAEVNAWVDAFQFIQMLRLRHQQQQAAAAEDPDNRIQPDQLNDLDRRILKESFRQARKLQSSLENYFRF